MQGGPNSARQEWQCVYKAQKESRLIYMLALHESIQSKHAVIKLGCEVPIRMSCKLPMVLCSMLFKSSVSGQYACLRWAI